MSLLDNISRLENLESKYYFSDVTACQLSRVKNLEGKSYFSAVTA